MLPIIDLESESPILKPFLAILILGHVPLLWLSRKPSVFVLLGVQQEFKTLLGACQLLENNWPYNEL
jgi:hypothetical protein